MKISILAGSTALAALAYGGAALADVTPEEVWQNWQDMSASYGQSMTATSQNRVGDTLTVEGVKIVFRQEGVLVEGEIDEVQFADNGDGTVGITMSEDYPLQVTVDDVPEEGQPAGEPTRIEIVVSQPGLAMTAGGGPEETSYDFAAPTVTISVAEVDGVDAETMDMTAEVVLRDMDASYLVSGAEEKAVTSDFSAGIAEMTLVMKDPETQGDINVRASIAELKGTSEGTLVGAAAMVDMASALKAGFTSKGDFTYGPVTMEFDFKDATNSAKGSASAAGGRFGVEMDEDSLAYGGSGTGVNMTMSGSQIPFPQLTLSYVEAAFDLLMPLSKSDTPQDFRFLTKLVDLKVSDEIWGMFDPSGQLPRDPATVVLDTSGTAKLDVDILDPANAEKMDETAPGELHSLDVNSIQVKVGGAELTGAGAFTFDNTDTTTFDGMPTPTGVLNLTLVGGNTLLDKLVAMGLVPQDQAMGARMMLGMFAQPGEGEDTLTSELEFKDKGFYANGQRLQ